MKHDPTDYPEHKLKSILFTLDKTTQRIIALAYASGARVSELNKITKEDISINEQYMEIRCLVLKKRNAKEKNLKRIALVRLDEDWVVTPINELINSTPEGLPLVNLNRFKIHYLLKKSTGLNPHMFRAIRATHLAQKGFTAHQLKHFFGWSSVAPSDSYVKLNVEDLRY
jgi:site-specific recombinase XerD